MKEILIIMIMNRILNLVRIKMKMNLMQLNNQNMMTKIMKKKLIDHLLKRLKRKFNSSNCNNKNLEQLKKKSKLDNQISHRITK